MQWLLSLTRKTDIPPNITLAYDNMCNLQRLRVAQNPLFLPSPYDRLWMSINKVIDVFHFRNHISPVCKELFSPAKLKADNPDFNTQVAEQTFSWIARYKHIVCAMNKTHHLFYLHRMVLRRNSYTSKCYINGRKPMLPKSKAADSQ